MGIMPDELSDLDVQISFQSEAKDQYALLLKNRERAWYIICEDSKIYGLWNGFNILCCLLSSYYYAYMAAFAAPKAGENNFTIMLGFEFVFLLSMGFNFLREFTKDGQTIPTRDLK